MVLAVLLILLQDWRAKMGVDNIKHPTAPKGLCPLCHGDGWAVGNNGNPNIETTPAKCPVCRGTGKV